MRRSKFIIGLLVLSLMLMGVAFAAWSNSVTLTTTATTGKIDISIKENTPNFEAIRTYDYGQIVESDKGWNFDEFAVVREEYTIPFNLEKHVKTGYTEYEQVMRYSSVSMIVPDNMRSLTYNFENFSPGLVVDADFELVNNSTYPVTLNANSDGAFYGNDDVSQALIDRNYVKLLISPLSGSLKMVYPHHEKQFGVRMMICNEIPDSIQLNPNNPSDPWIPIEKRDLSFTVDLIFSIETTSN